ncbi:hypothetical protein S40285_05685 [Stachybotrys chlorohalonatus IBT 40285]|uniref:F-box domain-containing protein n=1 Tax=Stachybotrys chlorohalonatus (strain IBT 40285) TaxID=1283841 RepID=A0A084QZV9_STAC4|nr:hypothetical protein S40285_05685 [Stachybotrys chlorohalonata IBT 40285]
MGDPTQATRSVLVTIELLEAILLQVDMVTLLTSAMRVNKTWHETIVKSPTIQQKLFFRPAGRKVPKSSKVAGQSEAPVTSHQQAGDTTPVLNSLLARKFERLFFDIAGDQSYERRATSFDTLPWSTSPDAEVEFTDPDRKPARAIQRRLPLGAGAVQDEEAAKKRFTRKDASWRRMLVSQPPPLQLGYLSPDVAWDSPIQGRRAWKALTPTEGGLRMGQLYDLVQHRAGHHPLHSSWFRTHWFRPQEPFRSRLSREICAELLASTCVVVEMVDENDSMIPNHPAAPADVTTFDAMYRCEEASITTLELEEVTVRRNGQLNAICSIVPVQDVVSDYLKNNWSFCRTVSRAA